MRGTWELADGTRIETQASDTKRWSVRVNGAEVPNTVTAHKLLDIDVAFTIAPGRDALITMRKARHGLEVDLQIDGQTLLYPGRRPFRCPACRQAQRAYERVCRKCNATLPDRAKRIQERRQKMVFPTCSESRRSYWSPIA